MPSVAETLAEGLEHHNAGRLDAAEKTYRDVLAAEPTNAEALHRVGLLAFQRGRLDAALDSLKQAIAADDRVAKYHANLGAMLASAGRFAEATGPLERAVAIDGRQPSALNTLAVALGKLGRTEESLAAYRRAIELDPSFTLARAGHIGLLLQLDREAEALMAAEKAIAEIPDDSDIRNNYALALRRMGRTDDALAAFKKATELDPRSPEAHHNLGLMLRDVGRIADAKTALRKVLELDADSAAGYTALAQILFQQGRLDEAIPLFRRAVELAPDNSAAVAGLLAALCADAETGEAALVAEHRARSEAIAARAGAAVARHDNPRDPARKLKVGFVASEFGYGGAGWFVEPLLAQLDRAAIEPVCFAAGRGEDATVRRIKDLSAWRDIAPYRDGDAAALVRSEQIDVLIDLEGHRGRLGLFAPKPAPVQATWAGYPCATGLGAIGYLLTDATVAPEGGDARAGATVIRLPNAFAAFTLTNSPPVAPLPAESRGAVTFGALVSPARLGFATQDLWARVLAAVPGSRLVLQFRWLDDENTAGYLRSRFARRGVTQDRVEFRAGQPREAALAAYRDIDVALDPTPASAALAAAEALWMGVPVVALAGDRMGARRAASIVKAAGLPEFIATTPDDYVAIAARLAGDIPALSALRGSLRGRVQASPLADSGAFARDFATALRAMWRQWCASAR